MNSIQKSVDRAGIGQRTIRLIDGRTGCAAGRSRVLRRVPALFIAALLLFAACDSSEPADDDGPPSLNGTFGGIVAGTNDTVSVRISIQEAANPIGGKAITGSGILTMPTEMATFDVSGSYVHPLIELDFDFGDRPPGTLSGQVSESRLQITATVAAPGVAGQVTLRKESA